MWIKGLGKLIEKEQEKLEELKIKKGLTKEDIDFIIGVSYAVPHIGSKCDQCMRLNKAVEMFEALTWSGEHGYLLDFDEEKEEILVAEERLMHLIQIANPMQPVRKIRLISTKRDKTLRTQE